MNKYGVNIYSEFSCATWDSMAWTVKESIKMAEHNGWIQAWKSPQKTSLREATMITAPGVMNPPPPPPPPPTHTHTHTHTHTTTTTTTTTTRRHASFALSRASVCLWTRSEVAVIRDTACQLQWPNNKHDCVSSHRRLDGLHSRIKGTCRQPSFPGWWQVQG